MGNSSSRNEKSSGSPSSDTKNSSSSRDEKTFSGSLSYDYGTYIPYRMRMRSSPNSQYFGYGSSPSSQYFGYNRPKIGTSGFGSFDSSRDLFMAKTFMPYLFNPVVGNSSSSDAMPINSEKKEETVIITRENWVGQEPKKVTKRSMPAKKVLFHHTATPSSSDIEVNRKRVQNIQNFHQNKRGYDDIGYNFLIEDGQIYEGRGLHAVGAHCKGHNSTSIGIAVIGDYSTKEPPEEVLKAMEKCIEYLQDNGVLAADFEVAGHKDHGTTECPAKVYELVKKIKAKLAAEKKNGK